MNKNHNTYKHGMSGTRIHNIWMGIKNRCTMPSHTSYKNYGAKGITICDRWLEFVNFYEDMGNSYFDGATVDRIDGTKGYTRENCRWATPTEQARNTKSNRLFEWDSEQRTIAELAEIAGLAYSCLNYRLNQGWELKKAMNTPSRPKNLYKSRKQYLAAYREKNKVKVRKWGREWARNNKPVLGGFV